MAKIESRKELEAWLDDKPVAFAQAIAMRTALRALPFIGELKSQINLIGAVFRAGFISWATRNYLAHDMTVVSNAAADAVRAANTSDKANDVANAVADSARANDTTQANYAAASTAYASTRAARAAVDAIPFEKYFAPELVSEFAAFSAIWLSITADANWLETSKTLEPDIAARDLAATRLWPKDTAPEIINILWRSLKAELLALNQDWNIWIDWYERRLNGDAVAFALLPVPLPYDSITASIAIEDNRFWERDPAIVNAEIKARLLAATPPPLSQDASTTTFEDDEAGRIRIAPLSDGNRLRNQADDKELYQEFLKSFAQLNRLSENATGADLFVLIKDASETLKDELSDINAMVFWARFNRMRRALRKHKAAIASKEYSPDKLDGSVAEDLEDVIGLFNHIALGQPILHAKDLASRGPLDPEHEALASADIRDFIYITATDETVTSPEAAKIIQDAGEDLRQTANDAPSASARVDAEKVQTNFLFWVFKKLGDAAKAIGKPAFEGVIKEGSAQLIRLAIQHKEALIKFATEKIPACVDQIIQWLHNLLP